MKPRARAVLYWLSVAAIAAVMGITPAQAEAATAPTWLEHWDLVQVAVVGLFGFGVWSARSQLQAINKKLDSLAEWRERISGQVTALQAEHDLRTCDARRHRDNFE